MCTSPLVRFRLRHNSRPDTFIGVSSYFQIKSLKKLQALFPNFGAFKSYFDEHMEYYYLPCRKCDECKMKYATDWSIRCSHELFMRGKGAFITLTVDDLKTKDFFTEKYMKKYCKRCVKGSRYIKYPINYTLCKGLIQDWLKRTRDVLFKRYGVKIRYFGCGEYGTTGERPHYHLIIFGYDFPDIVPIGQSQKGVPLYFSQELQDLWHFGMTTVQTVNSKACFYTAKYCLKKLTFTNEQNEYELYFGREPEFLLMSRGNCKATQCPHIDEIIKNCKGLNNLRNFENPYCNFCDKTRGGIGFDWLCKYYDELLKIGYCEIDGIKYAVPDYYKKLIELTNKERYDNFKLQNLNRFDEKLERDPDIQNQERLNIRKTIIKSKLKFMSRE